MKKSKELEGDLDPEDEGLRGRETWLRKDLEDRPSISDELVEVDCQSNDESSSDDESALSTGDETATPSRTTKRSV
jgi:hypothetical protein